MEGNITSAAENGLLNATMDAVTRVYSPVIMSQEWSKVGRLLAMVVLACIGIVLNGFFVSAFFVEPNLNKAGNVYLACAGLSDLILTSTVMPTSAVVLLSGQWDNLEVCYTLQFLTEVSTYAYNLFFMLVAFENYFRLCRCSQDYRAFISMGVGTISVLVFAVSIVVSAVGVFKDMDYDYCERKHYGNFYFRSATSVILHAIPFVLSVYCLTSAAMCVRGRARRFAHYKRSHQFERDYANTVLNLMAYLLYVAAWIPYLIIVHEFPGTSDSKYYHCIMIGVGRSVLTSFIYGILGRHFRRAFANLFNYCCCKNSLSTSVASRNRGAVEYSAGTGDVRVHIMQQSVNAGSPQRVASSSRETQQL